MQAFERFKYDVMIFGFDTYAVILNGKPPRLVFPGCRDVDSWIQAISVLNGISDEVLKQLQELGWIYSYNRQTVVGDERFRLRDRAPQIVKSSLKDSAGISRHPRFWISSGGPGAGQ